MPQPRASSPTWTGTGGGSGQCWQRAWGEARVVSDAHCGCSIRDKHGAGMVFEVGVNLIYLHSACINS